MPPRELLLSAAELQPGERPRNDVRAFVRKKPDGYRDRNAFNSPLELQQPWMPMRR
jgi:hypothetical protein